MEANIVEEEVKTLGQVAFEASEHGINEILQDGDIMPWAELSPNMKQHWEKVAIAVAESIVKA